MNVYSIVTENVSEAIPFTKKAKMMKQAGKAAKGATKDEARQLEVELLTYLKTSKQKPTVDAVLKYFDQKGLGNIAAPVLKNLQTKSMKQASRSQSRQDKARAAGQTAAKLGGMAKAGAQKAGTAIKNASGVVPAGQINQSMYEAEGSDVLTKREVKNVIKQVVAKGFGGAAGYDKSRFAQDKAPTFKSSQVSPEQKQAIDLLKKAGYKISK